MTQGFDGLFFGRLDYEDKRQRKKERNMEMVWSTNNRPGTKENTLKQRIIASVPEDGRKDS